jgi:hypothetical protein
VIGADKLLEQICNNWHWTREKYVPRGTSEDRWSCVRYSSGSAWYFYNRYGVSDYNGFASYQFTVRPVTLLKLES